MMLMPFLSLCVRESTSNQKGKALLLPTLIVYRQKTALLLSNLEPIVTEKDFPDDATLEPFKNILVARTLATWSASDGSVVAQIRNPSGDGVCLFTRLGSWQFLHGRRLLSPLIN